MRAVAAWLRVRTEVSSRVTIRFRFMVDHLAVVVGAPRPGGILTEHPTTHVGISTAAAQSLCRGAVEVSSLIAVALPSWTTATLLRAWSHTTPNSSRVTTPMSRRQRNSMEAEAAEGVAAAAVTTTRAGRRQLGPKLQPRRVQKLW